MALNILNSGLPFHITTLHGYVAHDLADDTGGVTLHVDRTRGSMFNFDSVEPVDVMNGVFMAFIVLHVHPGIRATLRPSSVPGQFEFSTHRNEVAEIPVIVRATDSRTGLVDLVATPEPHGQIRLRMLASGGVQFGGAGDEVALSLVVASPATVAVSQQHQTRRCVRVVVYSIGVFIAAVFVAFAILALA